MDEQDRSGRIRTVMIVGGGIIFVRILVIIGIVTRPPSTDPTTQTGSTDTLIDSTVPGDTTIITPDVTSSSTQTGSQTGFSGSSQSGTVLSGVSKKELIHMLVWQHALTASFRQYLSGYERTNNVQIVLIPYSGRVDISRLLQDPTTALSGIDIVMYPSDIGSIISDQLYPLQTRSPLADFFVPGIAPLVQSQSGKMIPYTIDPLMMLTRDDISLPCTQCTFEDLYKTFGQYGDLRTPHLLWGIDPATVTLMSKGDEIYPGYFQLLYQSLRQRYQTSNTNALANFRDIRTIDTLYRSSADILRISRQFSTPLCRDLPNICLIAHKKSKLSAVYLSDLSRRYAANQGSALTNGFRLLPCVSYVPDQGCPTRVWGRGVVSGSRALVPSLQFMGGYLQGGTDGQALRRPEWLPIPFADTSRLQLSQPQYSVIRDVIARPYILIGSPFRQKNFFANRTITDILLGSGSVDVFFASPGWEF